MILACSGNESFQCLEPRMIKMHCTLLDPSGAHVDAERRPTRIVRPQGAASP